MSSSTLRNVYTSNAVETVAPGKLIVMMYDRMALDLDRAEVALRAGNLAEAHHQLVHAQDIITELHSALAPDKWAPAASLAEIYSFIFDELVRANVQKNPDLVAGCRDILEPLRDAWSQAAGLGTTAAVA